MIITVAVRNVRTVTVLELNFETVADIAGIIDSIKVVDGSVSDAGMSVIGGECDDCGGTTAFCPVTDTAGVAKVVCFHFFVWFLVRSSPRHEPRFEPDFPFLSNHDAAWKN
jgi:hypothetical protein